LNRGPNGRGICRWCGVEVPKGRRTFCGDSCVHEWRLRTDPSYLRERVFARDRGVCGRCNLNTVKIYKRYRALSPVIRGRLKQQLELDSRRRSFWDADHILPVVEGGGECDLINLRTLCIWCHREETAKLRTRLNAKDFDEG